MRIPIKGGNIVNEGRVIKGDIAIEDGNILFISQAPKYASVAAPLFDSIIDATGCYVLPGVIDDHVHFREPGLTE